MYAERNTPRLNPGSLAAAVGVNGAILAALIFAAPDAFKAPPPVPFTAYPVPITPPPPPPPPEPVPVTAEKSTTQPKVSQPDAPIPEVTLPPLRDPTSAWTDPGPIPQPTDPIGSGGTATVDPPKPLPVLVGAQPDPRATFQPPYPAELRRTETEGRITVRVLIGADGRVKAVEPVGAGETAFFEATRRHALACWRFRPATQDGVPYEVWKVMNVRFELQD